jgi:pimeloyl-ACP methyl ester carboxylesterase
METIPTPKIEQPAVKPIVVLIHGIRTHASWAEMVAAVVEPACGVRVIPLRYGYFDVFRFLCPFFTRNAPIRRIVRELRDIRADNPTAEISVIAHSFGTYALVKALAEREVRLHRVILCGCIVPEGFRRADYRAQLGSDNILNDCGTHDIWPVLARSITWGYGASGTFGLGTAGVRDRFNKFSHGDYFNQEFVERYWVPFLRTGEIRPTDWERKRNTPPWWQSALSWLPLKYLLLVLLMLGGTLSWKWADQHQRVELDSGPEINIGHYLGMPTLVAPLKLHNGTLHTVTVQAIRATLISPNGREIPMAMEAILLNGQAMPALAMLTAKPKESVEFNYSYFNYTSAYVSLQQEAVTKAIQSGIQAPAADETLQYFTTEFTNRLVTFARDQFIWVPGEWHLRIRAQREKETLTVEGRFQLVEADVQSLWRITEHYRSGIGVLPNWRQVSLGNYQPAMVKQLDIQR